MITKSFFTLHVANIAIEEIISVIFKATTVNATL